MHLFAIMTNLRFQDVLDVLFLTVLVYYLYLWFWGTKAFKALVGLPSQSAWSLDVCSAWIGWRS